MEQSKASGVEEYGTICKTNLELSKPSDNEKYGTIHEIKMEEFKTSDCEEYRTIHGIKMEEFKTSDCEEYRTIHGIKMEEFKTSENEKCGTMHETNMEQSKPPDVEKCETISKTALEPSKTSACDEPSAAVFLLPVEMAIKIFSYLDQGDLLCVSQTCKCWFKLAFDQSLWTSVDLELFTECSSSYLCNFLKKIPGVQRLLGLANIPEFILDEWLLILTKSLHSLVEIDLSFCHVTLTRLNTVISNCSKLETISLEGSACDIDDDFVQLLCRAQQLKNLNFSHCYLPDEKLMYISKHIDMIKSLDINEVLYITDSGMETLLNAHYTSLQELTLDGEDLSDNTIYLVAKCTKLKTLQISFCELLTDLSLQYLQNLEQLQVLKLRKGPEFSKEAFLSFLQNPNLRRLRNLDLSECCNMSDKAVLALCQNCGPNLEYLNLSWCWLISETGLISIVDHCRNLKDLLLIGIDINGDCLHRIPEEMPRLTFCDFEKCSFINDEDLVNLVVRKPDIVIMNYRGEKCTNSLDF
ncbi:hypothetical protein SNE40_020937 [Patella caerulea]|uniref:F-box domain-containing protein n=1 Tax=Patella caerulea TaxID=87958 RepID=A0AAN8J0X1_PATCE